MKNLIFAFACAALAIFGLSGAAMAGGKIHTGGEKGAYYGTFCPPLPKALSEAYFQGYTCEVSGGTLDNIAKVMATPTDLGLGQADVYAKWASEHPDDAAKLTVIRSDIACEGLWMLTKNQALKNFGDVLGLARRIPFVLPPEKSGSAASFAYLRSLDPSGLGRATNLTSAANATAVIDAVANGTSGEVGFFVQFADPRNANIQKIVDSKLTIIPVASREMLRAEIDGAKLYELSEFNITEGSWFSSGDAVQTACTPVVLFTGNPESFTTPNGIDDQKDLIATIKKIPAEKLLPQDDFLAKLMKTARKVGGDAVELTLKGIDAAREAAEKRLN